MKVPLILMLLILTCGMGSSRDNFFLPNEMRETVGSLNQLTKGEVDKTDVSQQDLQEKYYQEDLQREQEEWEQGKILEKNKNKPIPEKNEQIRFNPMNKKYPQM